MKPTLLFKSKNFCTGNFGEISSLPDLLGNSLSNRKLIDDIHDPRVNIGYGRIASSYPYRQQVNYDRVLRNRIINTAVLENDYLVAEFLPSLGGRLWSLIDKKTGKNLLYTNDVIRFSNLAICNAWFSGGVEWNVGMIGHSPFTTKQLFTARLIDDNGVPVLRMYEFERIRSVVFQMDFWLEENDCLLNCRMRIFNLSQKEIPMYWWSNIAVPKYVNGQVVVPADSCYTDNHVKVYHTSIPDEKGLNVTKYNDISNQGDFFFCLSQNNPKYIANIDHNGYGLLQMSTDKLASRKLFSWGNSVGSTHWQDFLTKQGGHYVEIQAGIPPTQYGCVPMKADETWEWMEQYGSSTSVNEEEKECGFSYEKEYTENVRKRVMNPCLSKKLQMTKKMADTKGELIFAGSGYGYLHQQCVNKFGGKSLPTHLDFSSSDDETLQWSTYLDTGRFLQINSSQIPADFVSEAELIHRLKESLLKENRDNWYAYYQVGLGCLFLQEKKEGKNFLVRAGELDRNGWTCHALACVYFMENQMKQAEAWMKQGIMLRMDDLSYLQEGARILIGAKAYQTWIDLYDQLPQEKQQNGRLLFYRLVAMAHANQCSQAFDILNQQKSMFLDDLREGENSIEQLWQELYQIIYGKKGNPPERFCFSL